MGREAETGSIDELGSSAGPLAGSCDRLVPKHTGTSLRLLLSTSPELAMARVTEPASTRRLREYYKLGQRIWKESLKAAGAGGKKHFWGVNAKLQEQLKLSVNDLTRARQLARLYPTEKEFNRLCVLGQKQGKPLTKSHVMILVLVKDQATRERLAQQAAAEAWSVLRAVPQPAACPPRKS